MLRTILGFGHMHEKIFFYVFWKGKLI